MRKWRYCGLAAVLAIVSDPLSALDPHKLLSQYTTAVWNQTNGLPQDGIRAIAQTPDGYLWLGTDEGLTRFDGYNFLTYNKDTTSLPGNTIMSLATGRDGTLWIGTTKGLAAYRDGKIRSFTKRDGLPDNFIMSVLPARDGTVWIASGIYLVQYRDGKFATTAAKDLLPLRAVRALYEDPGGSLWVYGAGGLAKRAGNQFVLMLGPDDVGDPVVASIIGDRHNNIWLGSGQGIIERSPDGKVRKFTLRDGLPGEKIRAICQDRHGNIWAGTDAGPARLDGDRFTSLSHGDKPADWVRSMFEDREGNLWLGMSGGLTRLRDDRFSSFGLAEGLPSDEPVTVHQDRAGEVWIGYHTGGLVAFRNGKPRVYTTRDGLPSNEIFSIRENAGGDLLIATRAGLTRLRNGAFVNFPPLRPPLRPVVFEALQSRSGELWLAAAGGLYRLEGKEFRPAVPPIPGGPIANDSAVVLNEEEDGTIWAGTYGEGLWRIASGKVGVGRVDRFTEADGLGSDRIRALRRDSEGSLWIGTFGGGLTEYHNGRFLRYRAKDGLLSDNISHIEDDGRGSLWLSTTRGICRIPKRQLRAFSAGRIHLLDPENYGFEDGLRSTQCSPGYPVAGGGAISSDGRLWFPTGRGLAVIDPSDSGPSSGAAPIVHVLEVSADGVALDPAKDAAMKPGLSRLEFRYAGIHLSAPERVSYQYMLEGIDTGWVSASDRRTVNYNTLKHGLYTFRVRASVPGAPPGEASVRITVEPHFYERQYFLWLCAAGLVSIVYVLYRLHLKQIRGRLALVYEERVRMARELHDTLAQGVVGISSQLDAVAIKMNGHDDVARRHLELAQKMARHSLTEAKRSVMDLRASPLRSRDLPSALAESVRQWKAGFDVQIDVRVTGAGITGVGHILSEDAEQNVLRVAQEAVTNVLKHARATAVQIELRLEPKRLILSVKDDGRGFTPDSVFSARGGHFGLLGMRERAERLGGELHFSSTPGAGTLVEITVPLHGARSRKGWGWWLPATARR